MPVPETLEVIHERLQKTDKWFTRKAAPTTGAGSILRLVSNALPSTMQEEWLEEQRAYLADLDTWRARARWILNTVIGMPRYAYTVRTGDRLTAEGPAALAAGPAAALADGELGSNSRARVLAHLADCDGCRAEADLQHHLKDMLASSATWGVRGPVERESA